MSAPGTCHSGEEKREEREKQDKNEGPRDLGGLSRWLNSKESACNSGDRLKSLGGEDALEEVMVTHSSILAWGIPRTEEPGRLPSTGFQESRHNLATTDNKKRPWKARSRDPTPQAPATNTPLCQAFHMFAHPVPAAGKHLAHLESFTYPAKSRTSFGILSKQPV